MAAGADPLRLRVNAPGDLAKLLGERVAVNARQASILVQVVNRPVTRSANTASTGVERPRHRHASFSWHYRRFRQGGVGVDGVTLNFGDSAEAAASSADPEQLYAREKKLLEERRVLPLVALPEYIGLSQNVRDWMPARWGEWHLADVCSIYLSPARAARNSNATATPAAQPPPRPPEPNMSFRTKLLFVVLLTIFASVSVVAYAVTHYTQAAFEAMDAERTEALVAQFKKEFVQRGEEIAIRQKT